MMGEIVTSTFANEPGGDVPIDSGPDVYRVARAHRREDAAAEVERLLRKRVAYIERSTIGASHAVYFVTLAGGRRCVARFATHAEHRLDLEVWASERCRQVGLPVPRVLVTDLVPTAPSPPVAIYELAAGIPGHRATLSASERTTVFEQVGAMAADVHRIRVPGIGELERRGGRWEGSGRSWAQYTLTALTRQISRLGARALPRDMAFEIARRFEAALVVLDAAMPKGAIWSPLVHGDFRLENTLIERDARGAVHVSALLDFELVVAGDGALDLAWLLYRDVERQTDATAFLRGYGLSDLDPALEERILLYQLRYALEELWWLAEFRDSIGITQAQARISALLQGSLRHRQRI
jgi:aminoglycoside phosphotransferase (APT) family kinase protein